MMQVRVSPLKKNDPVIAIAGRDKGKQGKILRILREKSRAYVEKINMIKRHSKPSQKNPQGGIVEKEASIHISNLMYYCASCGKGVRLGVAEEGGRKRRVCRKCGKDAK